MYLMCARRQHWDGHVWRRWHLRRPWSRGVGRASIVGYDRVEAAVRGYLEHPSPGDGLLDNIGMITKRLRRRDIDNGSQNGRRAKFSYCTAKTAPATNQRRAPLLRNHSLTPNL